MPANSIFSAHDLSDLRRICVDVANLLVADGLDVLPAAVAEAVMNCAGYCSDMSEICFRAYTRLSASGRQAA